jgi:peptidyl-prolyl cis-trans isomerase B (cyclophilin B)
VRASLTQVRAPDAKIPGAMKDLYTKLAIVGIAIAACAAVMLLTPPPAGLQPTAQQPLAPEFEIYTKKQARIKTAHGDMVARFLPQIAPKTVKNFCDLIQKGFYNGLIFHRVIQDFMIQGGCPQGTGLGDPGYKIKAEFSDRKHTKGTLSMARSQDPDSAGSQFFIVHGAHASHLDGQYTAFGELVSGFEVLDKIATAPVQGDRPLQPVKMESVTLEDAK